MEPFALMPTVNALRDYCKSLYPTPVDFKSNGKSIGKYYPIKEVLEMSVVDIFSHFYEPSPDSLPNQVFLYGSIGGDGFSGNTLRMGKDSNLFTSSRYICGMKIARLCGDPATKAKDSRPIEYFVECHQNSSTLKPIGLFAGKETHQFMVDIWTFLLEELNKCDEFTVTFDNRTINAYSL